MLETVAPPHRLTYDDVVRMVEVGILQEHDRVELVDGVLVDMSPIGLEHDDVVAWLNEHFVRADVPGAQVRVQASMVLRDGYSFVQPDVFLVERGPRPQLVTEALLVVEVAQTSHRRDREKAFEYAFAGVPEYWLVDLVAETVTVHRDPASDGYRATTVHGVGDEVEPLVAAPPVSVRALLGR